MEAFRFVRSDLLSHIDDHRGSSNLGPRERRDNGLEACYGAFTLIYGVTLLLGRSIEEGEEANHLR